MPNKYAKNLKSERGQISFHSTKPSQLLSKLCALQDRHTEFSKEEGEQKQICISLDLNFRQEPNWPTCHGNSDWTQTWDSGQKKKTKKP